MKKPISESNGPWGHLGENWPWWWLVLPFGVGVVTVKIVRVLIGVFS